MPAPASASSSGHSRGWGCPLCLEGLGAAKEGGQTPNTTLGLCPCRYTGERPATNMVVIEAKLPSGYIPDKSSMVEVRSPHCPWDPLCPTGAPTPGVGPSWGTHQVGIAHPELCPSS